MEHFGLLGIFLTLIVATWAAVYVYQIQKTYDYVYLKPLFHYSVFYDIAVFSFLITIYFSINLPKDYISEISPVFQMLGHLFVSLFEIGLVYSMFGLYLGLKGKAVPHKIKLWVFVGTGLFILSFALRLTLPENAPLDVLLRSVQMTIYDNVIVLEIPILLAVLLGQKREEDRRKTQLRRSLAWLYLSRYLVLIGLFLVFVLFQLRGENVGLKFFRYSFVLILFLFFSVIPFLWIKFFFLKHADSLLEIVEDREVLDSIFSKYNVSKREQDILKLILDGKTNKDIEATLFISYHTVKNHVYNLYQKLGVKNRYELVHFITKFQKNLK